HFRENAHVADANTVISFSIEGPVAKSLKIADTWEGDVDHAVEEVQHSSSAEGRDDSTGVVCSQFEIGNRLFGLGNNRFLSSHGFNVFDYVAVVFACFHACTDPDIHNDFLKSRHGHHIFQVQFLLSLWEDDFGDLLS